jgi:hypothetical protein
MRKESEGKLFEKGLPIPQPSQTQLKAEREEISPYITFTITDQAGNSVCRINKSPSSGINRVNWDLRYFDNSPIDGKEKYDPFGAMNSGIPVLPGKYQVSLSITVRDTVKQLTEPVGFNAVTLNNATLPATDKEALLAFREKVSELSGVMQGTSNYLDEILKRTYALQTAFNAIPSVDAGLNTRVQKLAAELENLKLKFNNVSNKPSEEEIPPSPVTLYSRLSKVVWAHWVSTSAPTQMQIDAYNILMQEFPPVYEKIKQLGETDLRQLEMEADKLKTPVTPGRIPAFSY